MNYGRRDTVITWACILLAAATPAVAGESFKKAITDGKFNVDVRYRYERVDQQFFANNANASTARLRLGYATGEYHGFSVLIEFAGLTTVGADNYNSTANGKTDYPVVADPDDQEFNQGYLAYSAPVETKLILGRQRINRINQRFIGAVSFRQLEQTFDAFAATGKPADGWSFFAGYLDNANRIFGEHNPDQTRAELNLSAPVFDASYETSAGTLTAYAYFLDIEDLPMTSNKSLGLRFAGERDVGERYVVHYAAEYADQSDYADAPSTVDASYHLLEAGFGWKQAVVKLGYESLGDGTWAFQTPLATLHKFNGWADRFLETPLTGLEDLYLFASGDVGKYKLIGAYHEFSSDSGGLDYGTEFDFALTRSYDIWSWRLQYAYYDTDANPPVPAPPPWTADVRIFWASVELKF